MATNPKARVIHPHLRIGPHIGRKPGEYQLQAPAGKYRVVAVDTIEDITADYLLGDFISLRAATEVAREHGHCMKPAFVYDDRGTLLARFGSY